MRDPTCSHSPLGKIGHREGLGEIFISEFIEAQPATDSVTYILKEIRLQPFNSFAS